MSNFHEAIKPQPLPKVCPFCGEMRQLERLTDAVWRCDTCSKNFVVAVKP